MAMANIFDYIAWRGDLTFAQSPFNPVDNIIFSQLAYLPLDGIVGGPDTKGSVCIADAAEQIAKRQHDNPSFLNDLTVIEAAALVGAMGTAQRFKNCRLTCYVNQTDLVSEKQFSAVSVVLGKKMFKRSLLIVYRGTDMSLVGWKEDFNMSLSEPVPSQLEAAAYLEKMAGRFKGSLLVAGHSKGGNLAIYAASCCGKTTRRRIVAVYSNDAPGFHRQFVEGRGYRAIRSRIRAFVPQSSIIGMLFEHGETPVIVKSTETGLMQHDLCSWEIIHNDIARAEELSKESVLVDSILRDWINGMETEQRHQFIEALYTILGATHAQSVTELASDWLKSIVGIINSLKHIDEAAKKSIGKAIGDLFRIAGKNIQALRGK